MQDNYIFEYTALDHEEILCPEQFMEDFSGCAMYAKGTLKDRTKEEIVTTMKELDMEINKASNYDFPTLYFVNKIPKLTLDSIRTCTNRYGIITVMRLHSNDDMSSLTHKNNLTWSSVNNCTGVYVNINTRRDEFAISINDLEATSVIDQF